MCPSNKLFRPCLQVAKLEGAGRAQLPAAGRSDFSCERFLLCECGLCVLLCFACFLLCECGLCVLLCFACFGLKSVNSLNVFCLVSLWFLAVARILAVDHASKCYTPSCVVLR